MNDDSARVTGTSNVEHNNDTGLADFMAGWRKGFERIPWLAVTLAVIGLTNYGEKPVPSTRLAEILGRSVSEAEALARQWGPPGTRVEDGLISVYPERARSAARRHVQIGDRRFGLTGCGPDIFGYAPLARPSLHLEETCTTTGTPIRIVFTPSSVERVEPSSAVLAMPGAQELVKVEGAGDIEEVDANVCVETPLYSSAEAARGWLADHPGGRVFPIREAWELSVFRDLRDKMSALLNLDIEEVTTMSSDSCTPGSAPAPAGPDREFNLRWAATLKEGLPGFELIPHICRLVAEGEPVELSRLAAAAGQTVEEVEAKLRANPGTDWDEAGRLVGAGPTLRPTPHKFTFDGRTVYAFCASDALMFPIILGRSGVIESEAPGTGQPIRVEVTPERVVRADPSTAVVSLVRPDRFDDVRAEVCAQGNFWPSREAAAEWLAAYPQGMLHTVAEDFDLNREVIKVAGG